MRGRESLGKKGCPLLCVCPSMFVSVFGRFVSFVSMSLYSKCFRIRVSVSLQLCLCFNLLHLRCSWAVRVSVMLNIKYILIYLTFLNTKAHDRETLRPE